MKKKKRHSFTAWVHMDTDIKNMVSIMLNNSDGTKELRMDAMYTPRPGEYFKRIRVILEEV